MNSEQRLLTTKWAIYLYSSMNCLPPMPATKKKKKVCVPVTLAVEISKTCFVSPFLRFPYPHEPSENVQQWTGKSTKSKMTHSRKKDTGWPSAKHQELQRSTSDAWLSSCPLRVETTADPIRCTRWCPVHGIQREVWNKPVLGLLDTHRHTQPDDRKCFEDEKPLTQMVLTCT